MSALDILVSRLPDGAVRTDAEMLRERAIDSWALALLRRVRGDELPVPAAVVFPASTEEVAAVLAWASETAHGGDPPRRRLGGVRRGRGRYRFDRP